MHKIICRPDLTQMKIGKKKLFLEITASNYRSDLDFRSLNH